MNKDNFFNNVFINKIFIKIKIHSQKIKLILIMIILLNLAYSFIKDIKIKDNKKLLKKIKNYERTININIKDIAKFRFINSKNILLDKTKYKRTLSPDITVILTVFNQAHCLHKALRSIQNQSIKNLEIIIIDDCSSDNSTDLIKNYQREDNRIILIEHEINEGKIQSRSKGVKIAKGKYITIIDGDDALIHKDILYHSLYVANLGDLDVVEFQIIKYKNGLYKGCLNKCGMKIKTIVYQPELRTKFFKLKNNFRIRTICNRNICGKIIKNNIFKNAINNIGPKYTEDYIIRYEDTIMSVSLFQVSKSYYYMKKSGYYYSKDDKIKFNNTKKVCKIKENVIKGMDQVKLLQFLIEKTKNNKFEKQLIYHEMMSINYYESFYKYISHNFEMVYYIIDKIVQSKFILKDQKRILLLLKYKLKEKEKYTIKQRLKIL